MRRYLRRPSASAVIATVALVAAMGGTSYAAKQITSSNIKNNTIKSADVRNNSLSGTDIKNGSLRAKDFKSSDVPTGPAGPAGPAGPVGPAGVAAITYAVSDPVTIGTGLENDFAIEAVCPAGYAVTGGGQYTDTIGDITPNSSFPSDGTGEGLPGSRGWAEYVDNFTGGDVVVTVFAACVPASVVGKSALKAAAKARTHK